MATRPSSPWRTTSPKARSAGGVPTVGKRGKWPSHPVVVRGAGEPHIRGCGTPFQPIKKCPAFRCDLPPPRQAVQDRREARRQAPPWRSPQAASLTRDRPGALLAPPAGHRRQDDHGVGVGDGRLEPVQHPHVLVVEIDVHVAVELAARRRTAGLGARVRSARPRSTSPTVAPSAETSASPPVWERRTGGIFTSSSVANPMRGSVGADRRRRRRRRSPETCPAPTRGSRARPRRRSGSRDHA